MPKDESGPGRLNAVDGLRGIVMVLMALDHVRDYFHSGAMSFQPDDLSKTTAAIFFTRWVTHFCAPAFLFLAGVGAFFWFHRGGRTQWELSEYLWKRGLWLVVLELTVLRFGFFFSMTSGLVFLTVLWALGWSMVALGFLTWLPMRILAVLSVGVILLHNLMDGVSRGWWWKLLHQQGVILVGGTVPVITAYPLVPYLFVMAAGFCFGRVLLLESVERRAWLVRIGLGMTVLFVLLRTANVYGDPVRWTGGVLSFLRVTKNPPSLEFLLMTLGPALLLLAWLDRVGLRRENWLVVFGRVPLFYFLGHFYLTHALVFVFGYLRYGRVDFLWTPLPSMGGSLKVYPANFGYDLWVVYAVWVLVVVLMYPACLWFGRLKERRGRRDWWLGYL